MNESSLGDLAGDVDEEGVGCLARGGCRVSVFRNSAPITALTETLSARDRIAS
jgi:hypothetical protein